MIVAISSFITLTGLWCVLRKYLTGAATIITLLLLALGTNFFLMVVYSGAVQASILLALMVLVVWMIQGWHEKPGWMATIIAGLAMGIQVFIKPAGFASIFLFIFWDAYNKETFLAKWKIFRENPDKVLLIFVLFLSGFFIRFDNPQLFEGTWFCDYIPHTRGVYFLAPWLWQLLFSVKNGWIVYSPIVLLAIPGLYIIGERNKKLFYASFLYCLVFLLLLASSPGVTVPDNFTQPHATEIFAVLLIPFGYFTTWVLEGKWLRKTVFMLLFAMAIFLNLFQTWQFRVKILNPWFTTTEYYQAVFLKTHVDFKTRALQEFSNMDMNSFLRDESDFDITAKMFFDFENGPPGYEKNIQDVIAFSGKKAFFLEPGLQFTPGGALQLKTLPPAYPLGLRLSAMVYSETDFKDTPADIIITLKHKEISYRYLSVSLQDLKLVNGKWNHVKLDYVIPKAFDPDDFVASTIWYKGDKKLFIDDLKLELFVPKE